MVCPKCTGELKVAETNEERNCIEIRFVCKENSEHRFTTFIDKNDLSEDE